MDRRRRRIAGLSVLAAIAVMLIGSWFGQRLVHADHPGTFGYRPVQDVPPPVDLASVQRGWPNSLGGEAERNRLVAYLHDPTRQAAAVKPAAKAPATPIDPGALLVVADASVGKAKAAVCATCHDFTAGGPNRIGPDLWGVIGRDIASHPGFAYSAAMTAQQGNWTYDRLFAFLASPASAVPGTKMGFAGFARPEDRAAVIKYLVTLSNAPPPLPPPLSARN
ncbi:MAG: cytochrome c family protein [Sphingobium sp.]